MPVAPDFEKEVQNINDRVSVVEHKLARMTEAYVKNDLGVPDYDGHRKDHYVRIEQDKVVGNYKRTITANALWAVFAGGAVLLGQAVLEWLRNHIK